MVKRWAANSATVQKILKRKKILGHIRDRQVQQFLQAFTRTLSNLNSGKFRKLRDMSALKVTKTVFLYHLPSTNKISYSFNKQYPICFHVASRRMKFLNQKQFILRSTGLFFIIPHLDPIQVTNHVFRESKL